jgi:HEAT repeat protein
LFPKKKIDRLAAAGDIPGLMDVLVAEIHRRNSRMPVITEVEDRLVELGAPGLAAMVDALASDDVVRIHIAGRLRAEDDPRATPFLLDALTDHEGAVRAAAVEALSSSSDPVVVDALDRALHDQSPAVRAAAAFALGQHGDVRAVDALIEVGRSDPHRIAAVAA